MQLSFHTKKAGCLIHKLVSVLWNPCLTSKEENTQKNLTVFYFAPQSHHRHPLLEASFWHLNSNIQFLLERPVFGLSCHLFMSIINDPTLKHMEGGERIPLSNQTSFQELLLKGSVKHFSTLIIFKTFNESSLLNK